MWSFKNHFCDFLKCFVLVFLVRNFCGEPQQAIVIMAALILMCYNMQFLGSVTAET